MRKMSCMESGKPSAITAYFAPHSLSRPEVAIHPLICIESVRRIVLTKQQFNRTGGEPDFLHPLSAGFR